MERGPRRFYFSSLFTRGKSSSSFEPLRIKFSFSFYGCFYFLCIASVLFPDNANTVVGRAMTCICSLVIDYVINMSTDEARNQSLRVKRCIRFMGLARVIDRMHCGMQS